ncbi:hypothetical protein [Streptomyces tendae]|uniref:hypothetical protein n=1 Tax=Streptomyces tendae TaxID=1932 RepID=UPI00114F264F
MDQAIAGLAGTVVGGLIGVAGTLGATWRAGKDQKRNQHDHWRRQQRRDAYSQLLSEASEAIRVGGAALDAYMDGERNAPSLSRDFDDAVKKIDSVVGLVALEGPEEAWSAAMELSSALYDWTNGLVIALEAAAGRLAPEPGLPVPDESELQDLKATAYSASDDFVALCRRLLDT